MPTTRVPCSNAAKTRNPLKCAGVPQTRQRISAARGSKFTILCHMWGRHCCLTSFLQIADMCLSCEDIAQQSCAMVPRWQIFLQFCGYCISSEPSAACGTFQTCILNSYYGHTTCRSMVDIQSATAEIRRGKKKKIEDRRRNHWAKT